MTHISFGFFKGHKHSQLRLKNNHVITVVLVDVVCEYGVLLPLNNEKMNSFKHETNVEYSIEYSIKQYV